MQSDTDRPEAEMADPTPDVATPPAPTAAALARADAYRERFRQAQLIAAQVARARAAGGQPSETDAARMVAEFHARGGQVTVCPEAEEVLPAELERKGAKRRTG